VQASDGDGAGNGVFGRWRPRQTIKRANVDGDLYQTQNIFFCTGAAQSLASIFRDGPPTESVDRFAFCA
jgi:hypothetical protein